MVGEASERAILGIFERLAPALRPVARRVTAADFRTRTVLRMGGGSGLLPVEEHGEIKSGALGEAGESYAPKTFARIFGFSRKLIVNDDLNALGDFLAGIAGLAAQTLGDELYNRVYLNAAMSDGTNIFHANHGNLGSAADITVASLSAGRQAMRTMLGPDGNRVSVTPKFLVVGPAKETVAEQVLAALAATEVGSVNPFAGKLTLIVEPRITDNSWYLFPDPALMPVLEYCELDGTRQMSAEGPRVETRVGFSVEGIETKVAYDLGVGIVSPYAFRNPGV
jgi:hypothetical protein